MFKIILLSIIFFLTSVQSVLAVFDPRLVPNNKFGINIISPEAEIEDGATLVNTKGDWGYIVLTITKSQRDVGRLQFVLNRALDHHLIPIIRLATQFDAGNGYWKRPESVDAKEWADFLSKLHFPTGNKYIQVYNEVNRAAEWGGKVDPADYARELSKTIDAFKSKSEDFFILNAPLDLSLITLLDSLDPATFFAEMENSTPGIFSKLDGLASHSYPNPNFSASPSESGKIKIDGFSWELDQISRYSSKDLPVFITETGWKRIDSGRAGLDEYAIAKYYKEAFSNVWNDNRVVAVAPFLLSYPEPLFNAFSFKTDASDSSKKYYEYFIAIRDLPKINGDPERKNIISGFKIGDQEGIEQSSADSINFEFKNIGNYIWKPEENLKIKILGQNIILSKTTWSREKIYPGEDVKAMINIKSIVGGIMSLAIEVEMNDKVLIREEIEIRSNSPFSASVLKVKSSSAAFR